MYWMALQLIAVGPLSLLLWLSASCTRPHEPSSRSQVSSCCPPLEDLCRAALWFHAPSGSTPWWSPSRVLSRSVSPPAATGHAGSRPRCGWSWKAISQNHRGDRRRWAFCSESSTCECVKHMWLVIYWHAGHPLWHLLCSHWRDQVQGHISSASRVQGYHCLYVFDIVHFGVAILTSLRVDLQEKAAVVLNGVGLYNGTCLAVIPRRHAFPHLCQGNHCTGVKHAIAEKMVEFESNSVHVPEEPFLAIIKRIALRGQHTQMLHITPG